MRGSAGGVDIAVWASPGARSSEVTGVADGRLRLRLAAPAHEGKANAELVRFLARLLDVHKTAVTVAAGAGSRRKLIRVTGLTQDEARRRLRL